MFVHNLPLCVESVKIYVSHFANEIKLAHLKGSEKESINKVHGIKIKVYENEYNFRSMPI